MVAEKHTRGDYKEFTKAKCYHDFMEIIKYILSEEMKQSSSLMCGYCRLIEETGEHNQMK